MTAVGRDVLHIAAVLGDFFDSGRIRGGFPGSHLRRIFFVTAEVNGFGVGAPHSPADIDSGRDLPESGAIAFDEVKFCDVANDISEEKLRSVWSDGEGDETGGGSEFDLVVAIDIGNPGFLVLRSGKSDVVDTTAIPRKERLCGIFAGDIEGLSCACVVDG